jgi:hypothetical protein
MFKTNPMTPSAAARVLAAAASFDKRTIGEADAIAWAKALTWLEPDDCIAAVGDHYGRTTDYLMPGHIRGRVREILRDRQERNAAARGLPTGPLAKPETRAETLARVKAEVARVRAEREQHTTERKRDSA